MFLNTKGYPYDVLRQWDKKMITLLYIPKFPKSSTYPFYANTIFLNTSEPKDSSYFPQQFVKCWKMKKKTNIECFHNPPLFNITTFLRKTMSFPAPWDKKIDIKVVTPFYGFYSFPCSFDGPRRLWAVLGLLCIAHNSHLLPIAVLLVLLAVW